MRTTKALGLILLFILVLSACASGALTFDAAWTRPSEAGQNGAAYFVIQNGTASDDTLLSVSSEIAAATEIHMSMMDANEVMSMRMKETVPIPARGEVEFKPGGLHVMFTNLSQELKVGDTITLTLTFKKAGTMTIQVPVMAP